MRSGIQKLNAKIGTREAVPQWSCIARRRTGGYHETITVAFVRVIGGRLRTGESYEAFRDRNPDLFDRTLSALLRHYTKERLHSAEARQRFIEPDREELPRPSA